MGSLQRYAFQHKRRDVYLGTQNWEVDIASDISFEVDRKSILQPLYERTYSNLQCYAQQKNSNNMINSRHELYGKCNCKTQFLRLCTVGDAGADEA